MLCFVHGGTAVLPRLNAAEKLTIERLPVGGRVGISHIKVHQIIRKHRLKPHLIKRFRSSTDPQLREKLEDIIGLHLAPPKNAIVFCV